MAWTLFWDMHSGGGQKLEWLMIYIEAPEEVAKVIFQNRFGRSPERVTCTCCGEDYSIHESPTLEEASAYQRGLRDIRRTDKTWSQMTQEERVAENKKFLYLEPGQECPENYQIVSDYRNGGISLDEYKKQAGVKIIPISEVSPAEMNGELREEGYVWKGDR